MKIEDAKEKLVFLKTTYIQTAIGANDSRDFYSNLAIACELGAEAIEKQIPKEPIDATAGHEYIYGKMPRWDCPVCGEEVSPDSKYCDECGQRIR